MDDEKINKGCDCCEKSSDIEKLKLELENEFLKKEISDSNASYKKLDEEYKAYQKRSQDKEKFNFLVHFLFDLFWFFGRK